MKSSFSFQIFVAFHLYLEKRQKTASFHTPPGTHFTKHRTALDSCCSPPGGTAIHSYVLLRLKCLLRLLCYLSDHFQSMRAKRALHLPYNPCHHQDSVPQCLSPTGLLGRSVKSTAIVKESSRPERRASVFKDLSVLKLFTVKLWRTHRRHFKH